MEHEYCNLNPGGIYGHEALAFSAYFITGSEQRKLLLMLVSFVWEMVYGCHAFMPDALMEGYLYDCKERILEKKVDEGRGEKDEAVDK